MINLAQLEVTPPDHGEQSLTGLLGADLQEMVRELQETQETHAQGLLGHKQEIHRVRLDIWLKCETV